MSLKLHHTLTLGLAIGFLGLVFLSEIQPTILYNPNDWASMSIAFGASILTVVGIITPIITSNENVRRTDINQINLFQSHK